MSYHPTPEDISEALRLAVSLHAPRDGQAFAVSCLSDPDERREAEEDNRWTSESIELAALEILRARARIVARIEKAKAK